MSRPRMQLVAVAASCLIGGCGYNKPVLTTPVPKSVIRAGWQVTDCNRTAVWSDRSSEHHFIHPYFSQLQLVVQINTRVTIVDIHDANYLISRMRVSSCSRCPWIGLCETITRTWLCTPHYLWWFGQHALVKEGQVYINAFVGIFI